MHDKVTISIEINSKIIIAEYLKAFTEVRRSMNCEHPGGYICPEHFVLINGVPMRAVRKPEAFGQERECYRNAALEAFKRGKKEERIYCEGFALPSQIPFPIIHAWTCDEWGNVYDSTWKPGGVGYFGIAVKRSYLMTRLRYQKTYGLIEIARDKRGRAFPMLNDHPKDWQHPVMKKLKV